MELLFCLIKFPRGVGYSDMDAAGIDVVMPPGFGSSLFLLSNGSTSQTLTPGLDFLPQPVR